MGNIEMSEEEKASLIDSIAREIAIIKAKLDSTKHLYSKLDELTMALKDLTSSDDVEVFLDINESIVFDENIVTVRPQFVKVVDNFASRNTIFRSTGIKRFEVLTETVTERKARNLK